MADSDQIVLDYWRDCIATAAEETGLVLTEDQLHDLTLSVEMAHNNYSMAFPGPGGY